MTNPALDCVAPAKLNLSLRVLGRRADGYHLLDGLTAFCQFGDRLRVRFGCWRDRIAVTGRFAAALDGPNIVTTVLARYRALTGWPEEIDIDIDKRIPVAAGLGGGSADAAALLRILQAHSPDPLGDDALFQLALEIGADVPACLRSWPVRVSGIGETLRPVAGPVPACHLVLVNTGTAVSSASVFHGFAGPYSKPADDCGWADLVAPPPAGTRSRLPNDLIAAACLQEPVLSEVMTRLALAPGLSRFGMSGSGATCFGIFGATDAVAATRAVAGFRGLGWWSIRTAFLV